MSGRSRADELEIAMYSPFVYPWRIDVVSELSKSVEDIKLYCSRFYGNYPFENWGRVQIIGNKYFDFVRKYVRNKPDLLIVSGTETSFSLLLYAISRIMRVDVIMIVEENKERAFSSPILALAAKAKRFAVKVVHKNAKVIIAESDASRDYLLRMGCSPANVCVMPHGTNVDFFAPRGKDKLFARRTGLNDEELSRVCTLFAGEFAESKGADYMAEAISKLSDNEKVIFLIPAFGPVFSECAAELQRQTNVFTYPPLEFKDIPSLFSLGDIVVVPSKEFEHTSGDRSPNSLIEAMACGKAVIGTKVGGIPTIMGNAGILIRPNDANAISEAILSLLNDEGAIAQLGIRARDRAVTVLNNSVYATRILDLWRQNFKKVAE
jgi:glycosyltransferase involved in cell wall biosynthesis